MRSKTNLKNTFPSPLPPSWSVHPLLQCCRETRNRGCDQFITCFSCCFLLRESIPSSASAWGSSHGRQSSRNLSKVNPSHRLQFCVSCSSVGPFTACSSSGAACYSGVTSPARKPSLGWLPLCMDPQVPARSLLQHGLPSCLLLVIHLLQHGVLLWGAG